MVATVGRTAAVGRTVRVREAVVAVRVREAVVRVGQGAALGKLRLCPRGHCCSPLARSRRWLLRHLHRHLTPGYGK